VHHAAFTLNDNYADATG